MHAHAHCCIKDAIVDCLLDQDLTVTCDKDDCYDCRELHQGKCAVNVIMGPDTMGQGKCIGDPEKKKSLYSESINVYEASMEFIVEVYSLKCEGSSCKASIVSGWVTSNLEESPKVPVSRIKYQGSNPSTTNDGDTEFTLITMRFSVEYLFAPKKPWLLTGCLR